MTLSPSSRPSNSERRTRPSTQTSSPVCNSTPSASNRPAHAKPPSREFRATSDSRTVPAHVTATPLPAHVPSTRTSRRLSASTFQLSSEGPCSASKSTQKCQFSRPSLVRFNRTLPPSNRRAFTSIRFSRSGRQDILIPTSCNSRKFRPRSTASSTATSPRMTSTSGHMDHKETDTEPMATSVAR